MKLIEGSVNSREYTVMPRPRKATKACQTDFELYEMRLSELEKQIAQLHEVITVLKSNKQENDDQLIQGKFESISTEMEKKFKIAHNMIYEDKEILLGLEQQVEVSIPEKFEQFEEETSQKIEHLAETLNTVQVHVGKNKEDVSNDMRGAVKKIDAIEQDMKSKNVIIFGIAEENNDDDVKQRLSQLANNVLNLDNFKPSDIEMTYRLGKPSDNGLPRKILVKFKSKKKREEFYKRRKMTPICDDTSRNIYINDDLTLHRAKLFHDARQLVKQKRLHSTWTQQGNIMVKKDEGDRPTAVYNHQELRQVFEASTDPTQDTDDDSDTSGSYSCADLDVMSTT